MTALQRLAHLPGTWWIALNGDGEPSVWRPGNTPGRPERLASRYVVDEALWAVLAAVLPDRGACARCTAEPCPDHAGSAPVLDANGDPVPDIDARVRTEALREWFKFRVPAPECGHYIAASEARAGFTKCERCE